MAAKGARRKQKPQASFEQEQTFSRSSKPSETQAVSPDDSVEAGKVVPVSVPESMSHFMRNYAGSVLFHAHLAFLPVLLTHAFKHSALFNSWSPNAWTVLVVLAANASWIELLDNGCVTDPIAAFIGFRQEKQFCEVCGSKLNTARRTRWMLEGVSGFLGALTVGLLIAAFSPVPPFGSFQLLPQEVFSRLPREASASPSLLTDVLRGFTAAESRVAVAASLKEWIQKAASLSPLFNDAHHQMLEKTPPSDILQACSLLLDTWVAEFLCCFVCFLVSAVVTSASFYFELKHAGRIKLVVLIFAVAAGLPYCGLVGGPMLGVSFSALVAASRLDPWCFLLTAIPACLAAFIATRLVQPVPLALAHMRKRQEDILKKSL
ncbi:hypothetical protein Emed_002335 [Eimeria media]